MGVFYKENEDPAHKFRLRFTSEHQGERTGQYGNSQEGSQLSRYELEMLYVQEPLKKKKKLFKRPIISPLPWPSSHSVKSLSTMRKHVNSLSVEYISMESIIR